MFAGNTLVKDNVCPVNAGNTPNLGSELRDRLHLRGVRGEPACGGLNGVQGGEVCAQACALGSASAISPAPTRFRFPRFRAPANYASLPTVAFVTPNLDDDMHDGSIAAGDIWLYQNLSQYAAWAKANNSLLILTWDEDDNTSRNQIPR